MSAHCCCPHQTSTRRRGFQLGAALRQLLQLSLELHAPLCPVLEALGLAELSSQPAKALLPLADAVARAFTLADVYDNEDVAAAMNDGVLSLTIANTPKRRARAIPVKRG